MKYRKKPVEVEAMRWKPFEMLIKDVMNFMGIEGNMYEKGILSMGKYKGELIIRTLEGDMTVSEGDWIIKGVAGEFYPCKPDIFEQTYEPVDEIAETTGRRHGDSVIQHLQEWHKEIEEDHVKPSGSTTRLMHNYD